MGISMAEIKHIVTYYQKKYETRNPFRLANAMGIEVQIGSLGAKSGCYMYLKRSKCIWLNDNLESHEMEYAMAHELGHAIIHPYENCYFIKHKTFFLNSRNEIEANKFAIELLISDSLLLEYWQCSTEQIARLTGYAQELIELRLK